MSAFQQAIAKAAGQKSLLEAKIAEYEGYALIGNRGAADKCREEAHAVLDALFDGKGELAEDVRHGRFG